MFFKETPVLEGVTSTMTRDEFEHLTLSQWYVPTGESKLRSRNGVKHPCPFPITLAYNMVTLLTGKGCTVCDPFSGEGTTALAAHCLGRRYIGIDLEPEFMDIAQQQFAEVADMTPEVRVKWIRRKVFVPAIFGKNLRERRDGWGLSTHDGDNFKRRRTHLKRKPIGG